MNKNTLKDRPCTQPTWFSSAFSTALHQQSHNALHDGVNSLFDVADILAGMGGYLLVNEILKMII